MFGNIQSPPHLETIADLAHQNDRVGIRQFVATFNRAADQFIQQNLVRRVEQNGRELAMIIGVLQYLGFMLAIVDAEQIPGHPVVVFVQNLVVDVIEDVELKRFAGLVGRLDAIDHAAAHPMHEVGIEVGNGLLQLAVELRLPFLPLVVVDVVDGHPTAAAFKNVQVVVACSRGVPQIFRSERQIDRAFTQCPVDQSLCIRGMVLGIAAGRHIEQTAPLPFLLQSGVGELQAELGLADARCAHHDGQCARDQASTEQLIQFWNSRAAAIGHAVYRPRECVAKSSVQQQSFQNRPAALQTQVEEPGGQGWEKGDGRAGLQLRELRQISCDVSPPGRQKMAPRGTDDMQSRFQAHLTQQLAAIREAGLYKAERIIQTPQGAHVRVSDGQPVLNLCANNYLGLAQHPDVIAAARRGLDEWGYGLASVRFICGTQSIHKQLEASLSQFLGTDDTILYSSCFDANGGLFETLLGPEDAIISDELNHASIIDGIRLCKAQRFRYRNNDLQDLEAKLKEAQSARFRMIATDGVFSMDGYIANLAGICELADKYDALVMVDDSHAVGFVGPTGRGTPELHGVMQRVDILTGTLGKALGGASGGYTSGRREIIEYLRQRSRPYLFSNTLAPPIVAGSLCALELLSQSTELRDRLQENTRWFREAMSAVGFDLLPGEHPITPVMLGEAALAGRVAEAMLAKGVYVVGFSYPVVPQGKARIRTQISAAHTRDDLQFAVNCFREVKQEMGL